MSNPEVTFDLLWQRQIARWDEDARMVGLAREMMAEQRAEREALSSLELTWPTLERGVRVRKEGHA